MIVAPFTAEAVYSLEAISGLGGCDPSERALADVHRAIIECEARGVPLSFMETLWSGGVSFALEMPVNGQQCVGYVDIYNDGVVWVGAPNLNGSGNNVGAYCVDLSTAIDWLSDCWREQRFRWRA